MRGVKHAILQIAGNIGSQDSGGSKSPASGNQEGDEADKGAERDERENLLHKQAENKSLSSFDGSQLNLPRFDGGWV